MFEGMDEGKVLQTISNAVRDGIVHAFSTIDIGLAIHDGVREAVSVRLGHEGLIHDAITEGVQEAIDTMLGRRTCKRDPFADCILTMVEEGTRKAMLACS